MRNISRDHDRLQLALKQARWRPEQAKLIVDAWKASGQSMDAFTEKHGIAFDRLNKWAQRFHRQKRSVPASKLNFLPVKVIEPKPLSTPMPEDSMDIRLPTGLTVSIRPGFDPAAVKTLLETLGC